MKLKAKLISTIAAFAMVLCLTIVGVWAAASVTVNVTGNVTYTAEDVDATVTGTITGVVGAETKTYSVTFNATEAKSADTWALGDIVFEKGQPVVITLSVHNNSTERALEATIANNGAATGTNTTAELGTTTTATVAAGTDASFSFTIRVGDWNKAAAYEINLGLTLVNKAA